MCFTQTIDNPHTLLPFSPSQGHLDLPLHTHYKQIGTTVFLEKLSNKFDFTLI